MPRISEDIRKRVISFYLSENCKTQREIARELNISVFTVNYWIKKYRNDITRPGSSKEWGHTCCKLPVCKEEQRTKVLKLMQTKRKNSNFRAQETESNRKRRKLMRFLSKKEKTANEFQKVADTFFKSIADGPTHECYCCDRLWFKKSIRSLSKEKLISKGASEEFLRSAFYHDIGNVGEFCETCYDTLLKLKVPEYAVSNGFEFPEIPDCLKDLSPLEERLVAGQLPFLQICLGCESKLDIPMSSVSVASQLPRNLDEIHTVHLKQEKSSVKSLYDRVDPEKVYRAAEYLFEQDLYKASHVSLNADWRAKFRDRHFNVDRLVVDLKTDPAIRPHTTHALITGNNGPQSFDDNTEELAFPTIHCGKVRRFGTTYTKIANSEIRRSDRRAARPDYLLYAYWKFNHIRLLNAMTCSGRKKKLLKGTLLNEGDMRNIKNTPAYWQNENKRVVAAIRQWGEPTFSLTLSAAEPHWFELIRTLSLIVDKHALTEEEFKATPHQKKCALVEKDPVTCVLYFDYKYRELMKTWKSRHGPFGDHPLKHYYYRIRFQNRGSPYLQMLLWLEKAPSYSPDTVRDCENFIDEIMSCSEKNSFVNYQRDYCGRVFCPMDKTRILDPLDDTDPRRDTLKKEYESLIQSLADPKKMTFHEFLKFLDVSLVRYMDIVRSGISKPTVFLKRDRTEVTINPYSPKILNLMQSHMNIRFITDPYEFADPLNKPSRSPLLLEHCCESLRRVLGPVAANGACEVSAQEAAWSLLKLPMSKLSVNDILVPTFPPGRRIRMVREFEKLNDIFEWSIFDKYTRRPIALETLCLADFATGYEITHAGEERYRLLDCSRYVRERRSRKILRSVNYKQSVDPNEYYREQITLYTCWRDEKADILSRNVEALFTEKQSQIATNRQKYIRFHFDNPLCEEFKIQRDTMKTTDLWEESVYLESLRNANEEQLTLLNHDLDPPYYIFVTGPAGCGKSHLLQLLEQRLMRADGSDTVLKVAPTGKAAYHIRGSTLHAAFALPSNLSSALLAPGTLKEMLGNVNTLLIDEISRVSCDMFRCVDHRLRQIKGIDAPFGNASVVCFGDFRQLPPVRGAPVYQSGDDLWKLFRIYELTESVRHREDSAFASCLDRLAEGKMRPEDIALIESRRVLQGDPPSSPIHLFYSNAEVEAYNAEKIARFDTEGCEVEALDKKAVTSKRLPSKISLKVGAKYRLVHNLNTADGLVNGAMGILRKIDRTTTVQRLWIEFEDARWTPIERIRLGSREQFPIALSEALTLHKAQGTTYAKCVVHLRKNLPRNLLYVGLSRARRASGLYVVGEFQAPRETAADERLSQELARMRSQPLIFN